MYFISGMRWTKEYLDFDSFSGSSDFGGKLPDGPSNSPLKIFYCYYEPLNYGKTSFVAYCLD